MGREQTIGTLEYHGQSGSDEAFGAWYEKTYPGLSGYGLWLRGGELNTLALQEFEKRPLRVLIARLSTYRDTSQSLTHKLLYQLLVAVDGVYPDLAYLPPPKDAELMSRDGVPWLLGTTSKRGPRDFSVIAFSLSLVQEMINIPVMLDKSGIPPGKQERLADESIPLVILGGASALYTSLLFRDNPLVDGIFVGGDAGTITRIFQICRESTAKGLTKRDILAALTDVPGFFEPDKPPVIAVGQNPRPPQAQLLQNGPVLYDEEIAGRGALQLSVGCACFCGFCAEGFAHKPYREFDAQTLRSAAMRMKARMAVSELELYSFNFASYRDFYPVLWELSAMFPLLRLKSQRMDSIAQDPDLLDILHAVGKTSMTCAIEGISPRLRRYLHKSLDDAVLEKSLGRLLQARLRELKIFLIATGLEQDEDFTAFQKLLDFMATILRGGDNRPRIIFSVTILVRFPLTPLEFADAPSPRECSKIVRRIEQAVRAASFECRTSASPSDYWVSQILVRAATPQIADVVFKAREESAFVYYKEITPRFVETLKRGFEVSGIAPETPLKAISPPLRHAAPWANLDAGVDPGFLVKQWEAARAFIDDGYCGGTRQATGVCRGCGACTDPRSQQALLARPSSRKYSAQQLKDRLAAAVKGEKTLRVKTVVGPLLRGIPRSARSLTLARAMMLADERLIDSFRRRASLDTPEESLSDWLIGDDIISLAWDGNNFDTIRTLISDPIFIKIVNENMENRQSMVGPAGPEQCGFNRIDLRSPFPFDPAGYCTAKSLKFTVRRESATLIRYEFSKESLKKKIILACSACQAGRDIVEVMVAPGPKFNLEEFARTAFLLPESVDWVRIEMTARQVDPRGGNGIK